MKRVLTRCVFALVAVTALVAASGFYYFRVRWHGYRLPQAATHIEHVSLVNLIATPDKYDHKAVMVEGICRLEFEGNAIYLSAADFSRNAIWLDVSPVLDNQNGLLARCKFNGQPVRAIGVFSMDNRGHMGAFSGALTNTTLLETTGRHGGG